MKSIFNKFLILLMVVLTCTTLLSCKVVNAYDDNSLLNNFTTSAKISNESGTEITNNTLNKGQTYKLALEFAEDGTDNSANQMTMSGDSISLTYNIPDKFSSVSNSGDVEIKITAGSTLYVVKGNFTISDNKITLTASKTGQEENFNKMLNASNVQFEIQFDAKLADDATDGKVDFGGNIEKDIKINDDKATLTLAKGGSYNVNDGEFTYTVTATSKGYSENVVINDTVSGTVLNYEKDSFKVTSSNKNRTLDGTVEHNDNGFSYSIGSLDDGEMLTFTYKAKVDYDSFKDLKNYTFTEDQTKNTVTAKVNDEDQEPKEYTNKDKVYTPVVKYSGGTTVDNNTQTTTWKIEVNKDCKVSMAGTTVTDTLDANNTKTNYSGEGITVTKYKREKDSWGNWSDTKVGDSTTVSWTDLNVSDTSTSFVYTLPSNEEDDTTIYKYVIEYTTATDISDIKTSTTISNTARDLDSSKATATVNPSKDAEFSVTKSHDQNTLSSTNVDYTVTISAPKNGLSSLTITDKLPYTGEWTNPSYHDTYKSDEGVTVKIGNDTLTKDTDYTVTYTEAYSNPSNANQHYPDTLVITLTKNAIDTYFKDTTESKQVKVSYSTTPSKDDWGNTSRTNTATVNIDGVEKSASDTYTLIERTLLKEPTQYNSSWNTDKIDEWNRPGYAFNIYISGVTSDSVEIGDTGFDTEIFELTDISVNAGDTKDYIGQSGGNVTYSDGKFTLTPSTKTNGNYYDYYRINYNLKVKDGDAFKKFLEAARTSETGTYTFTNKATWGDLESSYTTTYNYPALGKEYANGDDNYSAKYTLKINSEKANLNNGTEYTVNDNLNVVEKVGSVTYDPTSFVIKVDGTVTSDLLPVFSDNNDSFTLTVPDGKYVEVSYKVNLIGQEGFKYNNTISALGKFSKSSQTHEFKSNNSGSGSVLEFTVVKLDSVSKQKVSGAKYELQRKETDGTYTTLHTFTTDKDGKFTIESQNSSTQNWTIVEGNTYRLHETSAPSGYTVGSDKEFYIIDLNNVDENNVPENGVISGQTIYVYDAPEDAIDLTATKTVDGKTPTGEYTFKLEQASNDAIKLSNGTQSVTNNGESIKFATLKFTAAGTYNFTISEVKGTDANMNYDSSVYNMKVVVTENTDSNGAKSYSLTKTITKDNTNVDSITFNNTTTKEEAKGSLKLTKTIKGEVTKEEAEGAISFKVTDPSKKETTYKLNQFTYDTNTKIWTLTIDKAEVGDYKVEEVVTDINGKTLSKVEYTIDNTKTEEGKTASATVKKDTTTTVAYENTYETIKEATTDVTFNVKKTVSVDSDSSSSSEAKTFTFKFYKTDAKGTHSENDLLDTKTISMNAVNAGSNSTSDAVSFATQSSLKEGTYYYTIKEENDNAANWTYDTNNEHKVVVTITKNDDNTLTKTITIDGTSTSETSPVVTFTNTYKKEKEIGVLELTKTIKGEVTKEEAEGAISFTVTNTDKSFNKTYKLSDPEGVTYDSSTNTWTITINNVPVDTYTVEEKVTDINGKTLSKVTNTVGGVSVNSNTASNIKVTNKNKTTVAYENEYTTTIEKTYSVLVNKIDAETNKNIAGAKLEIKDSTGKVVKEVTSSVDGVTLKLSKGTYTLSEKEAPVGYEKTSEVVSFEVKEDQTNTVIVKISNTKKTYEVQISKVDVADVSKELEGATLKITDKQGNIIKDENGKDLSWVSTNTVKTVKLKAGDYKLVEETAPDGYTVAETIEFSVDINGNVTSTSKDAVTGNKVTMKDEVIKHEVTISKVDASNSNELPGAQLVITDHDGKEVESWTSTSEKHKAQLVPGTYTLTEYQEPNGYIKAESITFAVDKDGKVTINGKEVSEVQMKDEKIHEVVISKVDATGGQEIEGAKLTITKKDDSKFETITWISGEDGKNADGTIKTHTVKLSAGTYVLTETTAPDGYEVAESITFTVTSDGKIKKGSEVLTKVVMKDTKKSTPKKEEPKKEEPKKYVVVNTKSK